MEVVLWCGTYKSSGTVGIVRRTMDTGDFSDGHVNDRLIPAFDNFHRK